jgi:glycogen synthase
VVDVALVTSSFLPRLGGVEEHVRNVARELRAQGLDVVVWTVDQGDDVPAEVDGIPVRVLPCPMPARSARSLAWFALQAPRAIVRWMRATAADRPRMLHVHCFGPNGPWALAASAVTRRPLLLTAHGETFMDAHDAFGASALLRRTLREALRRARVVTACSAFTARDLVRFGLDRRVDVVGNGVQPDEPAAALPAGLPSRFVLAMGRLVSTKGFDLLIDAFAQARLPDDVALVLAGDGPEADALRAHAERRGVASRVHWTGRLARGEVVSVTAAATALVVPSRVEAFGIVVLEGWRAGAPVIVTSHGGPADLVRDGDDGLVVDPFDAAALAGALETVVLDEQVARRLGAAGRERVREYTWTEVAAQYRRLYADRLAVVGASS